MKVFRIFGAIVSLPIVILIGFHWRPKWVTDWSKWTAQVLWEDK